jgi:hypothetical protein
MPKSFTIQAQERNADSRWVSDTVFGPSPQGPFATVAEAKKYARNNMGKPIDGTDRFRWAVVNDATGANICVV